MATSSHASSPMPAASQSGESSSTSGTYQQGPSKAPKLVAMALVPEGFVTAAERREDAKTRAEDEADDERRRRLQKKKADENVLENTTKAHI